MPHNYLAEWQWNNETPERGPAWRPWFPEFKVGSIDLRPLAAQGEAGGPPQGVGIFAYDRPVSIPGSVSLGQDLNRPLSVAEKDTWKGTLGIAEPLEGNTLLDVLWTTLTDHADTTGRDRPRPLMPTVQGNLELHLGGYSLIRRARFSPTDHPFVVSTQ